MFHSGVYRHDQKDGRASELRNDRLRINGWHASLLITGFGVGGTVFENAYQFHVASFDLFDGLFARYLTVAQSGKRSRKRVSAHPRTDEVWHPAAFGSHCTIVSTGIAVM
jgi:hypothetical protein